MCKIKYYDFDIVEFEILSILHIDDFEKISLKFVSEMFQIINRIDPINIIRQNGLNVDTNIVALDISNEQLAENFGDNSNT